MSAASVFKNFSNLRDDGKKKKKKKKKPPPPPEDDPYKFELQGDDLLASMTPEQVRRRLLIQIKSLMQNILYTDDGRIVNIRRRFGMDRTVEIISNLRDSTNDIWLYGCRQSDCRRCSRYGMERFVLGVANSLHDTTWEQTIDAFIMILRKYIPDNMAWPAPNPARAWIGPRNIVLDILKNQQGNWLPQAVSRPMNKEIQAVAKKYSKQFQKKLLIEAFKKGKSCDGKWSMRRESAIRTLQNSKPIIELRKRVNAPGGAGQEVARLSYAATQNSEPIIELRKRVNAPGRWTKTREWWTKAAAQGDEDAIKGLKILDEAEGRTTTTSSTQGAAAQENPSSSSQGETKVSTSRCVGDDDCWRGEESKEMCLSYNMDPETKKSRCSWKGGRRRKKTRRKRKRKTKRKSHRRRKSKKRKIKTKRRRKTRGGNGKSFHQMVVDIEKIKKIYLACKSDKPKKEWVECEGAKNEYGNMLKLFYEAAEEEKRYLETRVARDKIEELNLTTDRPLKVNDQILVTLSDIFAFPSDYQFYLINIDKNNIRYENGVRITGYDGWKIYIDLTSDEFIPLDNYLNISLTGASSPKGCTQKIVKKQLNKDSNVYIPPFSELSLLKNGKQFHLCKNDRENPKKGLEIAPIKLLTSVIYIDAANKDIVLGLSSYYELGVTAETKQTTKQTKTRKKKKL